MPLPAINAGFQSPCWQSSSESANAVHLEISNSTTVKYTGARAPPSHPRILASARHPGQLHPAAPGARASVAPRAAASTASISSYLKFAEISEAARIPSQSRRHASSFGREGLCRHGSARRRCRQRADQRGCAPVKRPVLLRGQDRQQRPPWIHRYGWRSLPGPKFSVQVWPSHCETSALARRCVCSVEKGGPSPDLWAVVTTVRFPHISLVVS